MLNRACAVSLLTVASLVACAGAATPAASSPANLVSNASQAAQKAQWDQFLDCFTPEARKQLMVSLARPIFSAASANDGLESELDRLMNSLGASRSTILSGKDLSRQARFVELLVGFAQQNQIQIPAYWTAPGSLSLNADKSVASFGSSQQNGVPTSFSLVNNNGSFQFAPSGTQTNTTMPTAQAGNTQSGPWVAHGVFPEFRQALGAMKHAQTYTPDAQWSAGVPSTQPDLNPGQTVLAAFPSQNGSTLHVCMLMGLNDGVARLLTSDGLLVEGVPGSLISSLDDLSKHIGRDAQTGDSVLAFRADGASFFGTITGFESGAPMVAYFDSDQQQQRTSTMCAVVPVNQSECVMYQMLAFECDGGIETGLCVAQRDTMMWLLSSGGLEVRSNDEVQLLAWTGTDTDSGLEQFRANSGNALASADFMPNGANIDLEITPHLMPFPAYAVGGVDTDNDN